MINSKTLTIASKPWLIRFFGDAKSLEKSLNPIRKHHHEIVIRSVNAEKMQDTNGFYDELVLGLSLPHYFGRNFNALNDCLTDLSWLRGTGFVTYYRKC